MRDQIIELLKDKNYQERKINQIASTLHQDDSQDYINFIKLMNHMEDDGDIIRDSHNLYHIIDNQKYFKGTLDLNKKGFGFVKVDEDRELYINERNIKDAYNKDTVLVEKIAGRGVREEGRIIRVVKRGTTRYVGEAIRGKRDLLIKVDDPKFNQLIVVDQAHAHGAMPGHKVVVDVKTFKPQIKGDIIKILGHKNDPGVDILSIVHAHDLEIEFPEAVYDQISNIGDEIDPGDIVNRVDLRKKQIVTIDGDDAKDLDDAISLETLPNGHYELGVHIADVSYYVEEGTPLDNEAVNRATSVYLVDRVIPMLPHKLSNGICSLNEGTDRYAISCLMEIDKKGVVVKHDIVPSVIHSSHRMTYTNVNKILEGDKKIAKKYEDAVDLFFRMKDLAEILRKKRDRKGAIDFDVDEAKVIVDAKGRPTDVVLRYRGVSDHIIEEFMLVANETVAEHMYWMDLPFIYRIHEKPKQKKLQQFVEIAKPLGYTIHGSLKNINPHELAKVIEESKDRPEHTVISTLLLRSMQKARYDAQCLGHFGLADEYYTHFTSPIRRYPDLLVHRLLRHYLFNNDLECAKHFEEVIPELAEQSSQMERVAIDTERDVQEMKMAEYMSHHIGEEFVGIVSSVTSFGMFIQLDNMIEGLVHISSMMDDYYIYDDKNLMLLGERTGRQYRLGSKVKVRVTSTNKNEQSIDFELVGKRSGQRTLRSKGRSSKRRRRRH